MDIDKTRWRELGLTPRQLSKKIGVTYSMAEFITQSYRKPVQIQGPCLACHHSLPRGWKCSKKNPQRCNKSGCEGAPGFATSSTSWARKRQICKEEVCDDECPTFCACKEVSRSKNSSCSISSSHISNKDNYHCKISPCNNFCKPRRNKPISYQKCSKGWKKQKCGGRKKVKASHKMTCKCCCSTKPCPKKRMFPLTIHLDVPLNVYLDDEDGIEIEGKKVQVYKKWKNKSMCEQMPIPHEEGDQCQNPEHPPDLWGEVTEDQEEVEMEQCNSSEDYSSEGKDDHCEQMIVRDKCQNSWWEKVQEGIIFLESLLSSVINKC